MAHIRANAIQALKYLNASSGSGSNSGSSGGSSSNSSSTPIQTKFPTTSQTIGDSTNNIINTTTDSTTVDAKEGNDTITGSSGNDVLLGGPGNDSISGGDGNDNLTGDAGNDVLDGGRGNDVLFGKTGDDTLRGGWGNDILFGSVTGNSKLYGDNGDDILYGGNPSEYLDGGAGNDIIRGGGGNDTIIGGTGVDRMYGGAGNDSITHGDTQAGINTSYGEFGNDTITGGYYEDLIDGGHDHDSLLGGYGNDTLKGGDGNDVIKGESGNDQLEGGNDSDSLYGGAGNDTLKGGDGNDWLYGGHGSNTYSGGNKSIFGENGNDYIEGDSGNDNLDGGEGNDTIWETRGGTNLIFGGNGNDTIHYVGIGSSYSLISGGNGNDQIDAAGTNARVYGNAGDDYIWGEGVSVYGGEGNDTLAGGGTLDYLDGEAGNDSIVGGRGMDTLYGGSGDDIIFGGEEDDRINPGSGADTVYGGGGNDTVVYTGSGSNYRLYADATNTQFYILDTINDHYDILNGIEKIEFVNGSTTKTANLRVNSFTGGPNYSNLSDYGSIGDSGLVVQPWQTLTQTLYKSGYSNLNIAMFDVPSISFYRFMGLGDNGLGIYESQPGEFALRDSLNTDDWWDIGYKIGARAGVEASFDLNTGQVRGSLESLVKWQYFNTGDQYTLIPTVSIGRQSYYDVINPYLKTYLGAGIWSEDNFAAGQVAGEIATTGEKDFNQPLYTLVDIDTTKYTSSFTPYNSTFGKVTLSLPNLSADSSISNGNLISSKSSDLVNYTLDVDSLVTSAFGWPLGLGFGYNIDTLGFDAKINVELIDININANLRLRQNLEIKLASITGSLTFTEPVNDVVVELKDGVPINFNASNYDINRDGKVNISYSLTPTITFSNRTELVMDVGGDLTLGKFFLGIDAFDTSNDWELLIDETFYSDSWSAEILSVDLFNDTQTIRLTGISDSIQIGI